MNIYKILGIIGGLFLASGLMDLALSPYGFFYFY